MSLQSLAWIAYILTGILAALFWFWSASIPLPSLPLMRLGTTTPRDTFIIALNHSATLNRWAAFFTGLSVIFSMIERFDRVSQKS